MQLKLKWETGSKQKQENGEGSCLHTWSLEFGVRKYEIDPFPGWE